jgi:hypothetical protein
MSYGPAVGPIASTAATFTSCGQVDSLTHTWSGASLSLDYSYNKIALNAFFRPVGKGQNCMDAFLNRSAPTAKAWDASRRCAANATREKC